MNDETIRCPRCGHANSPSAIECEKCGVTFALFFKGRKHSKTPPRPPADPAAPAPAPADKPPLSIQRCPKCGAEVDGNAKECMKCGIIFSKYFEFLEKKKTEPDGEDVVSAADDAADPEPAVAADKPAPSRESSEAEEQRLKELEKEALKLRSETEELRRQKEALEKAAAEGLQQQEAEQKRIQELEQTSEILKREKEALEKATAEQEEKEARRKEKALQKEKQEQEKAEALRRERMDQKKRTETVLTRIAPRPDIRGLLQKYEGKKIGLNYDDPAEVKSVWLAKVNEDHFSVLEMDKEFVYSFPFSSILSFVESADGMAADGGADAAVYALAVRVHQPVAKKKWGFI